MGAAGLVLVLLAAGAAGPAPAPDRAPSSAPAPPAADQARGEPLPHEMDDYPAADPMHFVYRYYWLVLIVQLCALVHAVRTGRGRQWLWIILFVPLLGAAAYVVLEVLPDLRRRSSRGIFDGLLNSLLPGREIRLVEEQLEIADTVELRKELAAALIRAGQHAKAAEVYRGCLKGALRDDAWTQLEFARALYLAGQHSEAGAVLEGLRQAHPKHKPVEREVLRAKTLEMLGRRAEALAAYEQLVADPRCDTEEGRCRLAQMLAQDGKADRARTIYADIVKRAKGFSGPHRRAQRAWVAEAKSGLRRTGSGPSRSASAPPIRTNKDPRG
jgi:hypothetical protein